MILVENHLYKEILHVQATFQIAHISTSILVIHPDSYIEFTEHFLHFTDLSIYIL